MPKKWNVEQTVPTTYVGRGGSMITGYTVKVVFIKWNEMHDVLVPSLDPKTVEAAVETVYQQRLGVEKLGEDRT